MDVSHAPTSQATSRLAVVLSQGGGRCEHRPRADRRPDKAHPGPSYVSIIPSGMEIWGYSDGIRYARGMSLDFDVTKLAERLADDIDVTRLLQPRLMFEDARVMRLCELVAAEIEEEEPTSPLYGDSLVLALFHDVLRSKGAANDESGVRPLPRRLLRRATEYMRENLASRIELSDLAALTGLSQSHFSRSFKAATGLPPYRWHLNARIERAQRLLLETEATLVQVALATGFADQAHMTRVFRKVIGVTPSQWKRATK